MYSEWDRWYIMSTGKRGFMLWAVIHQPSGQVLGFFTRGYIARHLCEELNAAIAYPLLPAEYDGSQWEVDPA